MVISSVCLVMVFFVVGLTLSHYWDVLQRRRYMTVPLCGLDGPFRYQLIVVTGKRPAAGKTVSTFAFCDPFSHSLVQFVVNLLFRLIR